MTSQSGSGGSTTLSGDTDVSLATPVNGQGLRYNGSLWTNAVLSGAELGYAQITAPITTASATLVDAAGLSVAVTVPSSGVMLAFFCELLDGLTNDAGRIFVALVDATGSTVLNIGAVMNHLSTGGSGIVTARHVPGAGARTYKVQWNVDNAAGTGRMFAGATSPASIRVTAI